VPDSNQHHSTFRWVTSHLAQRVHVVRVDRSSAPRGETAKTLRLNASLSTAHTLTLFVFGVAVQAACPIGGCAGANTCLEKISSAFFFLGL
jgi:hypothetical protein